MLLLAAMIVSKMDEIDILKKTITKGLCTYRCLNFKGCLTEPLLKSENEWVIPSHIKQ